jgi:AraC-like DNA-binding protein
LDANIELINEIIAAIETDESLRTVTAVAKAFDRSERWLQQLFQDYVGIGLKWLLQRHRLLAAAQQIRDSDQPNYAAIAYGLGYSSQQHFISASSRYWVKRRCGIRRNHIDRDARSTPRRVIDSHLLSESQRELRSGSLAVCDRMLGDQGPTQWLDSRSTSRHN